MLCIPSGVSREDSRSLPFPTSGGCRIPTDGRVHVGRVHLLEEEPHITPTSASAVPSPVTLTLLTLLRPL